MGLIPAIKKVPLTLTGVMLGLVALGNLLQSYSEILRLACSSISALIGVLLLVKVVSYPCQFLDFMKEPATAGVSATFPMALMLLAVYIKPWFGIGATVLWYLAVVLHLMLIFYFTWLLITNFHLQSVFPGHFVMYVGFGMAAITCKAFGRPDIQSEVFVFSLVAFCVLFPIVTMRYIKYRQLPDFLRPLFCIYAAPASLLLVAYVQVFEKINIWMLAGFWLVSFCLYVVVLYSLFSLLKLSFFPSCAAFTFPFVISAAATKAAAVYAWADWVQYLMTSITGVQTVIACCLMIYTCFQFGALLVRETRVS